MPVYFVPETKYVTTTSTPEQLQQVQLEVRDVKTDVTDLKRRVQTLENQQSR